MLSKDKAMKNTPNISMFFEAVQSPWSNAYRSAPTEYYPTTLAEACGDYYIGNMSDGSCLYFVKIGSKYYAFNNLAGYSHEHLVNVIHAVNNPEAQQEDWLVKRAVDAINKWKEDLKQC